MRALINQRREKNEEGFTLIELLLVIIILGILAAVVVFSVRGVSDRGQSSACKTSKSATITAIESYYAKNGTYPPHLAALVTDGFVADLPNKSGPVNAENAVNGPPRSGGGFEWTLLYTPGTGGLTYTFAASTPPGSTTDCD
jgi:prepilin-type N-terminal cleavage/methylation domain-containing protein